MDNKEFSRYNKYNGILPPLNLKTRLERLRYKKSNNPLQEVHYENTYDQDKPISVGLNYNLVIKEEREVQLNNGVESNDYIVTRKLSDNDKNEYKVMSENNNGYYEDFYINSQTNGHVEIETENDGALSCEENHSSNDINDSQVFENSYVTEANININKLYKDHDDDSSNATPTNKSTIALVDFYKIKDNQRPVRPDYRELALDLAFNGICRDRGRKKRYCDFVLVYDALSTDVFNVGERKLFEDALRATQLELVETVIDSQVFVEIYVSFERLCKEAENVCLQMPLEGFLLQRSLKNSFLKKIYGSLNTDNEVDMVSAPFSYSSKEIFHGIENQRTFFRSAYRSMLTKHILSNIKLDVGDEDSFLKTGINALLHSGSYKDAFILHERSENDRLFPVKKKHTITSYNMNHSTIDSRKELHDTWLKIFKFQPLWKIRNYYGEKIGLYFAWLGVLITSLWIPVVLGFGVFVYGIVTAYSSNSAKSADSVKDWLMSAFDNEATPYFAFLICLWGTVFCEFWKRKNAELAYKWDVDSFEEQEPNRPQFYGTKLLKDPITGLYEPYYPLWRKVLKSMGSIGVVLFMVFLVLISVASVIVYKVISRVDWFSSLGSHSEFASSLTSSVLNSISILFLGFVYKKLAYTLTNWENHQTRTKYEDALIFKLFGFQFVNSYASLFYIAFFRERTSSGVFELGSNYNDSCGANNDCMSMLSLQVAVLMVAKPMPKLFTDIVLPYMLRAFKKICCCFTRKQNQVTSSCELSRDQLSADAEYEKFLLEEYRKPKLGDFTLTEYTEKILQYGYLMMFAAAFPLAPLIALLTNIIDLRVDARRMLWFNRRPVPQRAQDIGMWFTILQFLNYAGMITNGFIIGMTSRFGRKYKTQTFLYNISSNQTLLAIPFNSTLNIPLSNLTNHVESTLSFDIISNNNLWIIIIFENAVLAIKFLLSYLIPDVPESVSKAQRQEKIQLEKLLGRSGLKRGPGKTILKNDAGDSTARIATKGVSKDDDKVTPRKRNHKKEKIQSHAV